jgi:polyhydroxybutyrate depolymerase
MTDRRRRALALAAALLLLSSCSDGEQAGEPDPTAPPAGTATTATATTAAPAGPVPSAGCEAGPVAAPGTTDATLRSGGEVRRYQLIVPADYDGTEPRPLLFALHSLTVDYRIAGFPTGIATVAPGRETVVVVPSGLVDDTTPYWLAVPSDPNHDLAFLDLLLERLEQELCLDTTRVFSTGLSNGGQMSSLLACRRADQIAGIVPLAGVEYAGDCGRPVPIMAFHGTDDQVVTYGGGGLNAARIADLHFFKGDVPPGLPVHGGVDEAMAQWAEHNGCDPEPRDDQVSAEVVRREWTGCDASTVLYIVEGGGHTWPGRFVPGFEDMLGYTTMEIDATELLFDFVEQGS